MHEVRLNIKRLQLLLLLHLYFETMNDDIALHDNYWTLNSSSIKHLVLSTFSFIILMKSETDKIEINLFRQS